MDSFENKDVIRILFVPSTMFNWPVLVFALDCFPFTVCFGPSTLGTSSIIKRKV